jgi:salicylate hydroxylase
MVIDQPKPYTLAIVGGGISGLVLAIALQKHNIPVTVYESASQFGEIGAGVGFEPNIVRVMERIHPGMKDGYLRRGTTVRDNPPKWFDIRISDRRKADSTGTVHTKPNKTQVKLDEVLFQLPAREGPGGGVHRAHFLEELVKLLPSDIAQFRKKLVDIRGASDGSGDAALHFADGTAAQHTAVIGCDGIRSRTREVVLGAAAAKPVFSGKYAYRGLMTMEKAVEIMGSDLAGRGSQLFSGYKGHVLTFPINHGTLVNGKGTTIRKF